MRPSRSVVDDNSPSSTNTDMTSLILQCQELRQRNESLEKKNDELKQQLTDERTRFQDAIDTMQHDMDTMKKTTTELDDQVTMLMHIVDKQESDTLDEVASNDSDLKSNTHSEAELQHILCNTWKKYREFKDHHNSKNKAVDLRASIGQSFKRITRSPSSRLNTIKPQLLSRTPSNDTYSTAECASDSSSSRRTFSSAEDNEVFTTGVSGDQLSDRFLVESLPWICEESQVDGLYFGQMESKSKLPDGLGEFRYEIGSNVKCIIKGEWQKGKLICVFDNGGIVNYSDGEISSDSISVTEL